MNFLPCVNNKLKCEIFQIFYSEALQCTKEFPDTEAPQRSLNWLKNKKRRQLNASGAGQVNPYIRFPKLKKKKSRNLQKNYVPAIFPVVCNQSRISEFSEKLTLLAKNT